MSTFKYRIAKTKVSLKSLYKSAPEEVQFYFEHLPDLLDNFPLDVSLAYLFSRVELAHNMALYCGVVKIHRADAKLARAVVEKHFLTRNEFRELFQSIYGSKVDSAAKGYMDEAEKVRDKVIHGKSTSEQDKRTAICCVLYYAVKLNEQTDKITKLKLFGKLQGFKGRKKTLDKATTRWLLKGIGLAAG